MKPNESPSHNPPNLSRRAAIKTAAAGLAGVAGWFTAKYRDGSTHTEYIDNPGYEKDRGLSLNAKIEPWTDPSDPGNMLPNYQWFFASPADCFCRKPGKPER